MKKGIKKQHIVNDNQSFCCGLNRINSKVESAFFYEDTLYLNDSTEVNHSNMGLICKNCMKLCHPTLMNDLLNQKALIDYKESLPKSNRERLKRNKAKQKNRIESRLTNHDNVIYLGYNPVLPNKPIMNPSQLLPMPESKPIAKPKKNNKKVKAKPIKSQEVKSIETELDYEESFIEFTDGIAIIRGFGNNWQVILNDKGKTESLTEFIPYELAMNEVEQLLAVNQ